MPGFDVLYCAATRENLSVRLPTCFLPERNPSMVMIGGAISLLLLT